MTKIICTMIRKFNTEL